MTFQEHLAALGAAAHLYANASNAFKDFLAWLAAASGRERPAVLMPSYIPAKLNRAARAAGCEVRFYEVHGDCRWDLDEVERRIDGDTIAVFHVHYFGFPGEVAAMRALATARGVVLVEDCALTLGAMHRGRALGTFGDVALFSMRKVLLYPEGGALVAGERFRHFRPTRVRRVSSCWSAPRFALQRAKHAYVRLTGGADPLRLVRAGPEGYMDGRARQELEVKRLSTFTGLRLPFTDVERAAARRREAYRYVLERLEVSSVVRPMFPELPDGVVPYSFPLLVRDERDDLRRALVREGILAAAGWPESPFDPALARTRALARSVVELPVHQATTRRQLDRALRCLERWARPRSVVRALGAP
ncbi:MAG TPA: DegT/DnrJ/EryC1/StrS family aminotransferase [Anaeromyxobacter sp.]|nr:DegT/DnrJ/EryC1/StrS family aminotransferase [Anaeromyxobacter sp.]